MIKSIISALMAISILSISAPVMAAETNAGIIEGQIVNGTEGGGSVTGHEITLKTFLNGEEGDSAVALTDAEGRFIFEGLAVTTEYSYEVSLYYQEAPYIADAFSFSENQTTRTVNITVYDSTTDSSAIMVATAHTIIYSREDGIDVTEYYLFTNNSDLTYIGSEVINEEGDKKTLSFSLPAGVTAFQPTMGLSSESIFSIESGFTDTMAVIPGMKEVSFSYTVDTGSADYVFPLKLDFPIIKYDLVVQGAEVVGADQLVAEEPIVIENVRYAHYSGRNLPKDTILAVGLSGLSAASTGGGQFNFIIWVVAAVVVLGGGLSFVYLTKKRSFLPAGIEDTPEQVRQRLLFKLAQLDDDFEGGKIAEEDYKRLRAEGKLQLVELMQKTREGKGGG